MRPCHQLPRSLLFQTLLSLWCLFLSATFVCYQVFGGVRQVAIGLPGDLEQPLGWSEDMNSSKIPVMSRMIGRKVGVPSVVVLTYQRCGSSFYGHMFNYNPSAFYAYEPIDSVYAALYGTKHGYNVPSDIYSHSNGTRRVVPDAELVAVSRFISNLLSCDIDSLPTDFLIHAFWTQMPNEFSVSSPYIRCVKMQVRAYRTRMCDHFNPWHCGKRFEGASGSRLEQCRRILRPDVDTQGEGVSDGIRGKYNRYQNCMVQIRRQIDSKCTPFLRRVCAKSILRATKTVRASMYSMIPLLKGDPQFRVIHLVRDPRAVVASRLATKDESIYGRYTMLALLDKSSSPVNESAPVREASMYCRRAAADLRLITHLQVLFPGRIATVQYESVVQSLEEHVSSVYKFLGFDGIPRETLAWLEQDMKKKAKLHVKKNSSPPLDKWKTQLTEEQQKAVVSVCSEFFSLVSNATDIDYALLSAPV